jgi:hypothetical protein
MESSPFSALYGPYNYLVTTIKELGSYKWLFFGLILTHLLIGALFSPVVTSDFERNLFYGESFWKYRFSIYDLTPSQIDDEYKIGDPISGILSYPNTTYDYPTIQLLFWAGVSILPFSDILGKWILSSFDILNFFLIYYLLKQIAGRSGEMELPEKSFALSYLLFSIPFSAFEGQSTAITITFLLLPLVLHSRYKYWSYLSIGLGFHWKYVSLLVLPYLLIKDRNVIRKAISGVFLLFSVILLLSFPVLVSSFILNYFGFFGRLGDYSGQIPSNNLLIFHICISSILSSGILVLAFLNWLGISITEKKMQISLEELAKKAYLIPFLILLTFLKIYSTAFPWYWMWFYPLIAIFPTKEHRFYTKLLGITFAIGLIDFVDMTVGIETFIGYFM